MGKKDYPRKKEEQKQGPETRELGSFKETQRVCVVAPGDSLARGGGRSRGGARGQSRALEAPLQVAPFLKVKRKPVKDFPQRNGLVRTVL